MSVDTNVKNKNLAPYRKLRHEQYRIFITPRLAGMAESMRVVTKGTIAKKLSVEFRSALGDDDGSCEVC